MKQVLSKKVFFKGRSYGNGYVYALVDPRTNEVRYIGSTNNLLRRLNEHMRLYGGNKRKNAWLKELKDSSMLPYALTLEVLEDERYNQDCEDSWIEYYMAAGADLLNAKAAQEGA